MLQAIRIDRRDNVATAICYIPKGNEVMIEEITLKAEEDIPLGHKIALTRIREGEMVIKYGEPIGKAIGDIKAGQHVHIHNVLGLRGKGFPLQKLIRGGAEDGI